MRLIYDHHTHTSYSHGHGTPEANVCVAIEKGLRSIAITEHAPAHLAYGVRGEKLMRLRREVDRLTSVYANDIEVLFGIECNLTAFGECDLPDDANMFDVRLLAYHRGILPRDRCALSCTLEAMGLKKGDPLELSRALLAAAEKYKITIFSHPSLYAGCDIASLARGARELGVLIELNGSRLTLSDEDILTVRAEGAEFIINSDAHVPQRVGDGGEAVSAAQRLGVDVVNLVRA